jgi:acetamidase/formamidase
MIHVETVDCFSNGITPENTNTNNTTTTTVEEWQLNPVTGPIYINGVESGDILVVTIHDIIPTGVGVATCSARYGQLSHTVGRPRNTSRNITNSSTIWSKNGASRRQRQRQRQRQQQQVVVASPFTRFFDLSPDGFTVTMREVSTTNRAGRSDNNNDDNDERQFNWDCDCDDDDDDDGKNSTTIRNCVNHTNHSSEDMFLPLPQRIGPISFPTTPMLGVIGVAPTLQDSPISTMPAGYHGGNLDNKYNGIGSIVYIPVNVPGALLSIGDMHASQGDGEICGTGIEIGGHVLLSCAVLRKEQVYGPGRHNTDQQQEFVCRFPITETPKYWMTYGVVVENIPKATIVACEEASKLLVGQWGFTPEEAFLFLSVRGDLGLCQSCHPDKGTQIARMRIPKLIGGDGPCPRPFRCLVNR